MSNFEWVQTASVTTGGKPYFYHLRYHTINVAWDRLAEKWALSEGNTTIGFYPDPGTARSAGIKRAKEQQQTRKGRYQYAS